MADAKRKKQKRKLPTEDKAQAEDKAQSERFIAEAIRLQSDESGTGFERALDVFAPKPRAKP